VRIRINPDAQKPKKSARFPVGTPRSKREKARQQGYILLTLLLFVALLAIFAAAIVPTITFQIKRDREEEMIHRGTQYSRAVRRYFKKLGRYPTRIEDLQTTNNIHFLRKVYKDPITGKDFKLLHVTDVQMQVFGAGGFPPNGMTGNAGAAAGAGFAQAATAGAMAAVASQGGQQPNLNNAQPAGATGQSDTSPSPGDDTPGGADIVAGTGNGSDSSSSSSSNSSSNQSNSSSSTSGAFGSASAQTFGGGPIVGVASTSKAKSIRTFNKKDHYDKWQFYYDPSNDRGGLITTPNQPPLQGTSQVGQAVNGQGGIGPAGAGQANGAGSSGGFGSGFNQSNPSQTQQPVQQQPQPAPDQQQ
jgi:type II secretory pathway pseudopilin PulG